MPTLQTTRSTLVRSLAAAASAALLLATLAVPALAHGDHDADTSRRGQALGRTAPGIGAELAQVRAATARYHNVEVALADGYALPRESPCVASPDGAMGYHYVNYGRMDKLEPTQPQALLYHPGPNGKLRLVGVEYISPRGPEEPPTELFGQRFTDAIPNPSNPTEYIPNAALHVWLWQANPAGMFAAYNPNLSCPDA